MVIAGIVVGCSSGTQRFSDGPFNTRSDSRTYGQSSDNGGAMSTTGLVQSSPLPPVQPQPNYGQPQQLGNGPTVQPSPNYIPQGQNPSNQNLQPQNLGTLPQPTTAQQSPAKTSHYIVQSGDTLLSVSRKTGVSVNTLKQANNLTNGSIRVGQMLVIAKSNQGENAPATSPNPLAPQNAQASQHLNAKVLPQPQQQPRPIETNQVASARDNVMTTTKDSVSKVADDSAVAPQSTGITQMRWPIRGRILRSFGQKNGMATNDGIDIMAPEGSSVKAAENGIVIYAGDGLKEFGNTVLIKHQNNIVTVYGNNSKILVKRGQQVRRGDEIAKSGMSGSATSPQLHFEVRKNSSPVNPIKYLEN